MARKTEVIMTAIGDYGDIDNKKYYKEESDMTLDRAAEILNHMIESGLFEGEVQVALCIGLQLIGIRNADGVRHT